MNPFWFILAVAAAAAVAAVVACGLLIFIKKRMEEKDYPDRKGR